MYTNQNIAVCHTKLQFQKSVFARVLRFHGLRSAGENHDLFQLAINDPLILELAYSQIVEQVLIGGISDDIQVLQAPDQNVVFSDVNGFFRWLTSHRSEILAAIESIVDAMGGIEIASYLHSDIGVKALSDSLS